MQNRTKMHPAADGCVHWSANPRRQPDGDGNPESGGCDEDPGPDQDAGHGAAPALNFAVHGSSSESL
jgi:hypothetical protein